MSIVYNINNLEVTLIHGDITNVKVDAIVNAANPYLMHGGGVAYAIVKKGGYEIQEESNKYVKEYGPVQIGNIAVTSAGRLKAKYIIHAIGPKYGIDSDDKLESAVRKSLEKADELNLRSIALPAISTGVYGYPYDICARIMANVLRQYKPKTLTNVIIVLYDLYAYSIFKRIFDDILISP
jgi:O-acetyl-ADP-ribose deacetylase (regulator of RNase III)